MDATSEPASGSDMPMLHAEVPSRICGMNRACCSGVPNCNRVGPIWRSANQDVAIGAPVVSSASNTTKRSSGLRPPPPASTGQVMPNHPRLAISSEKARSGAAIQVSSVRDALAAAVRRSEEHTSELQSLMRISYAVFCLKKKKKEEK